MANKKGIKPVSKEIEAKFFIEKDEFIKKLKQIKAKLVTPERTMKRKVFGIVNEPKYFRVRDEGGKITMTCKVITGRGIHDVFESEIEVSNFDKACEILTLTGLPLKAYQETTRETWEIDDVEIVIDHWPFLPFVTEIEGSSEKKVKQVCAKLGLDFKEAMFGAIDRMYALVYDIHENEVNTWTDITFENKKLEKMLLAKKRK